MTESLTLTHDRAPGDIVTMTALVRDIHAAHPGRFRVSVETPCKDVWAHNPHLVARPPAGTGRRVRLTYGESIRRAGTENIHFLTAWHHNFEKQTGIKVPLTLPKPDLHLSAAEKATRVVAGRYWVVLSGGKTDFTTKHYLYTRHQKVVDGMTALGIPVVQAGAKDRGHHHPELKGALNLVGKTTLREFIRLIAQADGVVCTITAAMHIAAAFDRPCVVTAGGREEAHWEAYTNDGQFGKAAAPVKVPHRYLHTMGLLSCCKTKGCWRNKVARNEPDSRQSYCHDPVASDGGQRAPRCMDMLPAEAILEGVVSYYAAGVLPPV